MDAVPGFAQMVRFEESCFFAATREDVGLPRFRVVGQPMLRFSIPKYVGNAAATRLAALVAYFIRLPFFFFVGEESHPDPHRVFVPALTFHRELLPADRQLAGGEASSPEEEPSSDAEA